MFISERAAGCSRYFFSRRGALLPLGLIAVFLIAFSLPLLFTEFFSGVFTGGGSVTQTVRDAIFPDATVITRAGDALQITGSEQIDPVVSRDFLLTAWFKLRTLPKSGDRLVLLSKFDERSRFKRGYALGLARDGQALRPMVYWRDGEGRGGWRFFTEVDLEAKQWFMFGLSYYGGRYLGLHVATLNDENESVLTPAGGYDLGESVIPRSSADLVIGAATDGSLFRGKVGPLMIAHSEDLAGDLKEIFAQILKHPRKLPSAIERDGVQLWSEDGRNDLSTNKHAIIFQGK